MTSDYNHPARRVYLDNSSTTPVRAEVLSVMLPFFAQAFGNASSIHRWGKEARVGVETAREKVAYLLGAEPSEIVFTSGGTEADNLALRSTARLLKSKGNTLLQPPEHHAVLHTCQSLEKEGFEVTCLPSTSTGWSELSVAGAIRPGTILISVIHGQNEVGPYSPLRKSAGSPRKGDPAAHRRGPKWEGPAQSPGPQRGPIVYLQPQIVGPKGIGAPM